MGCFATATLCPIEGPCGSAAWLLWKHPGGTGGGAWHTSFADYADINFSRHITCTERGGRQDWLHIQSTTVGNHKTDAATYERIKKEIKAILNINHGSGTRVHICIKPYVAGQTYSRMIGYCTKDMGLSHFIMRRKNTTDEEIEAGKEEHTTLKLDYMEDKIAIKVVRWVIAGAMPARARRKTR